MPRMGCGGLTVTFRLGHGDTTPHEGMPTWSPRGYDFRIVFRIEDLYMSSRRAECKERLHSCLSQVSFSSSFLPGSFSGTALVPPNLRRR